MKKIAFIGTHGVGKTTLCHDLVSVLKKTGKNAEFLGEVARDCPFPINEGLGKNAIDWIIFTQIVRETEKNGKCDYLVCDRGVFDNYVYYLRKAGRDKFLEKVVAEYNETYSLLLKVPIKKEYLIDDGTRSIDDKFQEEIDSLIDKTAKELGIKTVQFQNLNQVLSLIR